MMCAVRTLAGLLAFAGLLACLFVVFVVTTATTDCCCCCCCVIYEPIISDDIQRLSVSARIVVFFDDFFDFSGHLGRRHFFVVEVIITRRWFEFGGG